MNIRCDLITCYAVRRCESGHEFLQLHRSEGDYMGGTWQAISGQIEPGEVASQAALRELFEEAGMVPMEFYVLPIVNTFYILTGDTLFHAVPFCAIVEQDATIDAQ